MQLLFANQIKKAPRVSRGKGWLGGIWCGAGDWLQSGRFCAATLSRYHKDMPLRLILALINRASNLFRLLPQHPVEQRQATCCAAAQARNRDKFTGFIALVDELRQLLAQRGDVASA
jgi:hypothetical protein